MTSVSVFIRDLKGCFSLKREVLTTMRATVNEDSSHLYKILSLSMVQTYLHIAETLLHRWMQNFQKRP